VEQGLQESNEGGTGAGKENKGKKVKKRWDKGCRKEMEVG
jgi:hypothetical protein